MVFSSFIAASILSAIATFLSPFSLLNADPHCVNEISAFELQLVRYGKVSSPQLTGKEQWQLELGDPPSVFGSKQKNDVFVILSFKRPVVIHAISVKRPNTGNDNCLNYFYAQFRENDIEEWRDILNKFGSKQLFRSACVDSNVYEQNEFNDPIIARQLRIVPLVWTAASIGFPVNVIGCEVSEVYQFRHPGSSAQYDVLANHRISTISGELSFFLRTVENEGVVLVSQGTQQDRLIVQLLDGFLLVSIAFGPQRSTQFNVSTVVNDGFWHRIRLNHKNGLSSLFVDDVLYGKQPQVGLHIRLDLDTMVNIGFTGGEFPADLLTYKPFAGCLTHFYLDNVDLLKRSHTENVNVGSSCQDIEDWSGSVVSFRDGNAWLLKRDMGKDSRCELRFELRTFSSNATVLKFYPMVGLKLVQILLSQSHILLDLGGLNTILPLQLDSPVSDGRWHRLSLFLSSDHARIQLDGGRPKVLQQQFNFLSGDKYYIGGSGFVGCIRNLVLNGRRLSFSDDDILSGEVALNSCPLLNRCEPDPCLNDGQCTIRADLVQGFKCLCNNFTYGSVCEHTLLPISCEEHFRYGLKSYSDSGSAAATLIDLDGAGELLPVAVHCQKDSGMRVWSSLSHNLAGVAIKAEGFSPPSAFLQEIRYKIEDFYPKNLREKILDRFIDRSQSCSQEISFECHGGTIIGNSGKAAPNSYWVGRRGVVHAWGARAGTKMCACGTTGSCIQQLNCNCDSGQKAVDFGNLTDKSYLPVQHLHIGDTDYDRKFAVVKLGPLICTGFMANERPLTVRSRQSFVKLAMEKFGFSAKLDRPVLEIRFEMRSTAIRGQLLEIFGRSKIELVRIYVDGPHSITAEVRAPGYRYSLVAGELNSSPMNDNNWHRIVLVIHANEIVFAVDGQTPVVSDSGIVVLADEVWDSINLGGSPNSFRDGFLGSIRHLLINGEEVNLSLDTPGLSIHKSSGVVFGYFGACDSFPCANGGVCHEFYDHFECDCDTTEFSGPQCHDEVGVTISAGASAMFTSSSAHRFSTSFSKRQNDVLVRLGFIADPNQSKHSDAIIMTATSSKQLFSLQLLLTQPGFVELYVRVGDAVSSAVCNHSDFADGNFYEVTVSRNRNLPARIELKVTHYEGVSLDLHSSEAVNWFKLDTVTVGNYDNSAPSFSGCVSRLRVLDMFPLKHFGTPLLRTSGNAVRPSDCFSPSRITNRVLTTQVDRIKQQQRDVDQASVIGGTEQQPIRTEQLDDRTAPIGSVVMRPLKRADYSSTIGVIVSLVCVALLLCAASVARWCYTHPGGVYKTHEDELLTTLTPSDSTETAVISATIGTCNGNNNHKGREWYI